MFGIYVMFSGGISVTWLAFLLGLKLDLGIGFLLGFVLGLELGVSLGLG